jgi:hypothetical protein
MKELLIGLTQIIRQEARRVSFNVSKYKKRPLTETQMGEA